MVFLEFDSVLTIYTGVFQGTPKTCIVCVVAAVKNLKQSFAALAYINTQSVLFNRYHLHTLL